MRNKLLIASVALSGLVSAQCNYKCGYNQDENGNTVNEEGWRNRVESIEKIYEREINLKK